MLIFELMLETIVFSNFDKSYKQRLPEFDAYSHDQLKIQIHSGSVSVLVAFFWKIFKKCYFRYWSKIFILSDAQKMRQRRSVIPWIIPLQQSRKISVLNVLNFTKFS